MESPLVRIVHDPVVSEHSGQADVQGVGGIVERIVSQKQNPHNPARLS